MKVRVIHRDPRRHDPVQREAGAVAREWRNPDPQLHPFERERELQRALVATKLERMFAKPLVGVLDGHRDAVRVLARAHGRPAHVFSGACDGEVRHWDLQRRVPVWAVRAHEGFVRGLCVSHDDRRLLTCGDDGLVKEWPLGAAALNSVEDVEGEGAGGGGSGSYAGLAGLAGSAVPAGSAARAVSAVSTLLDGPRGQLVLLGEDDVSPLKRRISPTQTWQASDGPLTCVDHHWSEARFVTAGARVAVWDVLRSQPLSSFAWNQARDGVVSARYNPADGELVVAAGTDNAVAVYDLRAGSRVHAVRLRMRSNAARWNPMRPQEFVAANEDGCLYTFDLRRLDQAATVHYDFTNAVIDVDYSPTGEEFVAAGFDKTLRIFGRADGKSREVYHGKRMQMVLSCCYSADSRFVLSGSADFCVRIWKSVAWEKLGPVAGGERRVLAYREALKKRYQNEPAVRRILKHRHVPRLVKRETEKKLVKKLSRKRKEENVRLNSKPGKAPAIVPEKKRAIVSTSHDD